MNTKEKDMNRTLRYDFKTGWEEDDFDDRYPDMYNDDLDIYYDKEICIGEAGFYPSVTVWLKKTNLLNSASDLPPYLIMFESLSTTQYVHTDNLVCIYKVLHDFSRCFKKA